MAVDDVDTDRTVVKTYVPAYQRDVWDEEAEELDMSRSEFIRSMVQAGRRGFNPGGDVPETPPHPVPDSDAVETGSSGDDANTPDHEDGMETRVLELLDDECLGWKELVDELTTDIESELEGAIETLQDRNEIQHKPREGGYVRIE